MMGFGRGSVSVALLAMVAACAAAPDAYANLGYEPASVPIIQLSGEVAHGISIDQATKQVYVTLVTAQESTGAPGQVEQLEPTGAPSPYTPFRTGEESFFIGVAVNPLNHDVYASQFQVVTPFGIGGSARMDYFSPEGKFESSFALSNVPNKTAQLATDSSGNVYYPNASTHAVEVYDEAGSKLASIDCSSCPGGSFIQPASVAVDSADHVYVVDIGDGRVVKFSRSGSTYTFDSVFQSGMGAAAVGIDPSDDSVFIGDLPEGFNYHVVAYTSAGVQFDDFGTGLFTTPRFGAEGAGQIAVNATTHRLYVGDVNNATVHVFDLAPIGPPTVTAVAASAVEQTKARLNATVNANRHGVTECHFELVSEAEFQLTGFENATSTPCSSKPAGSTDTGVSATVSALAPETAYRFRATASNNGGTSVGASSEFTTLQFLAPTPVTGAASQVGEATATIAGQVNPNGSTTSCHFDYGPTVSYGSSVPCKKAPGAGNSPVAEEASLTGLSPATTYHYRLVASNAIGTASGEDASFATRTPPPLPPPPPPPIDPTPVGSGEPQSPAPRRHRCKKGFVKKRVHGKRRCVRKRKR